MLNNICKFSQILFLIQAWTWSKLGWNWLKTCKMSFHKRCNIVLILPAFYLAVSWFSNLSVRYVHFFYSSIEVRIFWWLYIFPLWCFVYNSMIIHWCDCPYGCQTWSLKKKREEMARNYGCLIWSVTGEFWNIMDNKDKKIKKC